jgi:hypothetical protein
MVYFKTRLVESSKEGYGSKKGCFASDAADVFCS